jgi:hypothetical protein
VNYVENSTGNQGCNGGRGRRRRARAADLPKANKTETSRARKWVWTSASALHIRTALPIRANKLRENNMAKKTLKKSKKIQATKPLMAPGFKK